MVSCAIPGCNTSKRRNPQNYTFHTFPVSPDLREKWLHMISRENWTPHKYSTICSKHFHEQCFSEKGVQRRKLRSGSIPTICMPVKILPPCKSCVNAKRNIGPIPSISATLKSINNRQRTPRKKRILKTATMLKEIKSMEENIVNFFEHKIEFSQKVLMVDGTMPSLSLQVVNRICDATTFRPKFVQWQNTKMKQEYENVETTATMQDAFGDMHIIAGVYCFKKVKAWKRWKTTIM